MAKINHILFGQGKGKVGGLVLQRYEGMNVVREKPISVKNPQSTKQTTQRGKLKLASQITAQFKEVISTRLAPISIYERTRRSASVSEITKAIGNADPEQPSIFVSAVRDAINSKSVSGIAAPTITKSSNEFSITATDGDTCVYVLCEYDADGNLTKKISETFTSTGAAKLVAIDTSANTSVIMVVAYHATTDSGRATISNMEVNGSTMSVDIARSISAGDIVITNMGTSVQQQA